MAKRIKWQEHIDPLDLIKFEATYNSLFSQSISFSLLFFLQEHEALLQEPISIFAWNNLYKNPQIVAARIAKEEKKLLRKRISSDFLFKLIPEWVNENLDTRLHQMMSERETIVPPRHKRFEIDNPKALSLHLSLENILCLSTWGLTISEFVKLAILGSDASIFKLIQFNKQFVSAKLTRNRIELAQYHEDKDFFNNLIKALKKDAPGIHYHKMTIGTAVLLLWFIGFKDLSITQLYDYMMEKKYLVNTMTESAFRSIVYRLGLRK